MIRNFLTSPTKRENAHGGLGDIQNTLLFSSADFASSLRFLIYTEIEPGHSIGYHQHGQDEELYVILAGRGTMTIDGSPHPVQAGDAILNKPGGSHGLLNDGEQVLKLLVFEAALPAG